MRAMRLSRIYCKDEFYALLCSSEIVSLTVSLSPVFLTAVTSILSFWLREWLPLLLPLLLLLRVSLQLDSLMLCTLTCPTACLFFECLSRTDGLRGSILLLQIWQSILSCCVYYDKLLTPISSNICHTSHSLLFACFFHPITQATESFRYIAMSLLFLLMPRLPTDHERRFRTTTLYKRSRHYFDISRINRLEQNEELNRRKPTEPAQAHSAQLDEQLNSNFSCTDDKLCERVQMDIDRTMGRFEREKTGRSETAATEQSTNGRSRTLDMSKMLSREYFDREKNETMNESKFCNFEPFQAPKNHTVDFKKYLERGKQSKRRELSVKNQRARGRGAKAEAASLVELNSEELGRKKETLIFDQAVFRPLIDLKKHNPQRQTKTAHVPQRHFERIWKGQLLTRKGEGQCVGAFYHGKAKWDYSQMEARLSRVSTSYLAAHNKATFAKLEWSSLKRKTDLVEQRRQEILARKQIEDVKGEICDVLYFRRNQL